MVRRIDAIYENGVLRPLTDMSSTPELTRLELDVVRAQPPAGDLRSCVGIMPDEDADEMRQIVDREFEQVDERDWN